MHILAGVLGQLVQGFRIRNALVPAVEVLVNRLRVVKIGLRHRYFVKAHAVHLIRHAYGDLLKTGKYIQLGNKQVGKPVDAHRLARKHRIVPAASARTPRVHAKLTAGCAQKIAHLIEEFGGERTGTHAGGVCLLNTDHARNAGGANTRPHAGAPGGRV